MSASHKAGDQAHRNRTPAVSVLFRLPVLLIGISELRQNAAEANIDLINADGQRPRLQ